VNIIEQIGGWSTSYCFHPNSLLCHKDPTQEFKNLHPAKPSTEILPNTEYQANEKIKKKEGEEIKKCLKVKLLYLRNNITLYL